MAQTDRRDAPGLPDFSLLKRLARDQLIYLLEQLPGKKDLFIDADLMSPLDRIANVTTLKQHEVDKLYKVELKPVVSVSDQLCFLIRPRIQTVKWIADVVKSDKAVGRFRRYKIIFTPQKFYACETVLEEQGVYGDVTSDEWEFYLLPLDDDIISLELPEFFRDNFLEGDQRWVTTAGSALRLLHFLFGPFSKVYGIGRCAKMVYESWREQVEDGEKKAQNPDIGNVFLIDRDVDFVTPLCSQVVYEGLVDDIFRIKCGSVEFGPDVTSTDKSLKVMLNSQDKVFNEIRNEHFSNVFGFLSQKARNLQTAYDKRCGMDIKQMKAFVAEELKGLKQEHRLLSLHIGACESIMKKKTKQDFQELLKTEHSLLEGFEIRECITYIEEHINRQVSMIESLRLLCLLSLTENGLLPKDYRSLKAQYLQSYGIEHLLSFANLRQIGLLVEQQPGETLTVMESKVGKLVNDKTAGKLTDAFSSLAKKSNFRALSKRLMLIPKTGEEYDLRVPRDMAYIFSGAYIPLSCKLIEQVLERDGWTGFEEVTRMLNGHEFAVTGGNSGTETRNKTDPQRIILVMFLGGCTFSEISALRFLGRERGCKFIVLTTAITNSSRLLESLLDNQG
ncbi:vacuolar protein sorting-associated protein 33B [Electrophorus electricus]|uniref:Vacuolar protein sorting-associated protein 33B n=1 Tax=Electrophorus electricus TaxID=8005 RepID=A0A4W4GWR4_ELEEL|nr:vacuolar protein sorting-associated protein 33B [Electrophorus electricus]